MSKRTLIVVGLVLGLVLGGLSLTRQQEPAYKGQLLSDWIVRMDRNPGDAEARAAVHQLGSNSIPLLLDWLARQPKPLLRGRLAKMKDRVLSFMLTHKLLKPTPYSGLLGPKVSYRSLALDAFTELGPDARAAIPELIRRLANRGPSILQLPSETEYAYMVLPKLAPASILPLIETLSTKDEQVFALAAAALGNIGPEAEAAIPVLQSRLGDSDPVIRLSAADNLGKLGGAPALFLPVLLESLQDPAPTYLEAKVAVLRRHKQHTRAAAPLLLNLLTNSSPSTSLTNAYLRAIVQDALQEIAPETLSTNPSAGMEAAGGSLALGER